MAWTVSDSQMCSLQDLYRILISSLQASSAHFEAVTLETLTLGLWGLSNAHAGLSDDVLGSCLSVTDRSGCGALGRGAAA